MADLLVDCAAAASLEVGFVTVNGTLVNNTLTSGGTTLFPIGGCCSSSFAVAGGPGCHSTT